MFELCFDHCGHLMEPPNSDLVAVGVEGSPHFAPPQNRYKIGRSASPVMVVATYEREANRSIVERVCVEVATGVFP